MNFDKSAYNYYISSDHKTGDDLNLLAEYFANKKFRAVLDIATAAGHCAKAFKSEKYYFSDISINMLNQVKHHFPYPLLMLNSAENIPVKNSAFDLVSCRIALHHFKHPHTFFQEAGRVLKQTGFLIVVDSVVDKDDAYLNTIEFIRDSSHIRSYTIKELVEMFAGKFRCEFQKIIYKKHDFDEWAKRLMPSEIRLNKIKNSFLNLPKHMKYELNLETNGDKILSYTDKKIILILRKL